MSVTVNHLFIWRLNTFILNIRRRYKIDIKVLYGQNVPYNHYI